MRKEREAREHLAYICIYIYNPSNVSHRKMRHKEGLETGVENNPGGKIKVEKGWSREVGVI